MGLLSGLGALGKIAGAFKSFMNWLNNRKLMEAGRNEERANIASQQAETNQKSRKARADVRNGDDAKRLRRERYNNRNSK